MRMNDKTLTIHRLSVLNLKHRLSRTVTLAGMIGVLFFVLFGGVILAMSLRNGLDSLKNRLGADLIVVPENYDKGMEAILLKGEPCSFYFNQEIKNQIEKEVEGIEQISTQFFLTSLGQECCSFPVQIIGFDRTTDFSITPWISKVYKTEVSDGTVIVGSDITVGEEGSLKFFDQEYLIAAVLEKTGTGLDQAVFVNMNTMKQLYEGALSKGQNFLADANPNYAISSVLIKVEEGYDIEEVAKCIQKDIEGIKVIQTQNMIKDMANSLESLFMLIDILIGFFLVMTLGTLVIVFTMTVNERKKEFAIWRTLGATRKYLAQILLRESFEISVMGGMAGVALASMVVLPFSVYIGDQLGLPYLQPQWLVILPVTIVCIILSALVGPLAATYSVVKISKAETYFTMREGEI